MSATIVVPRLAESISDAVLVEWLKGDGESVKVDEPVATLETDKAAVEIAATADGVLKHQKKAGDQVHVGDVLGEVVQGNGGAKAPSPAKPAEAAKPAAPAPAAASKLAPAAPKPADAPKPAPAMAEPAKAAEPSRAAGPGKAAEPAMPLSPAVRRMVEESGVDPSAITPSGPGGRILKEDVQRHLEGASAGKPSAAAPSSGATSLAGAVAPESRGGERVVPMSRIRQRIAERLVKAQHTAAILTTFNEIDMTAVMELRARHKEVFEKVHGVKLGFMSFFGRACVLALQQIPEINGEIRGTDLVYHDAVHLGIAVGTPRGLVVPVIKNADALDLAGLEREIARLAEKGRLGTLTPDEMSGGTFTISNGGVYGSLLSTPILNPPQSGILGMHKIEKRPVAANDLVVIRPMMYVALSYDHRIVDGEQAVTFLVRVKERLEDPERMLLGV